jgi:hypothetical protein
MKGIWSARSLDGDEPRRTKNRGQSLVLYTVRPKQEPELVQPRASYMIPLGELEFTLCRLGRSELSNN